MNQLRYGSRGPDVAFLQLALRRAGYQPGETDGLFLQNTRRAVLAFQKDSGLRQDGVVGANTTAALMPWYTGFVSHIVRSGDSLYRLAQRYGSSLRAIETANPALDPLALRVGSAVIVPLPFDVVPTEIDWFSGMLAWCVRGLAARCPFLTVGEIGRSVMGKPLYQLLLGRGERRVLYNAGHHANEWITTPLLMKYAEELCKAYVSGGSVGGVSAGTILGRSRLCLVPSVDPDGMDLVTGALRDGPWFEGALAVAGNYPGIPFPSGWKANIRGTDLNLQYPAGWERAREIKAAQGFVSPAPRDYVGPAPLSAPESRAMYEQTLRFDPERTLSYHTQGNVIYWRYLDREPAGSRALALELGRQSGYAVEDTPYASGFAGYKDWFIQDFDRPGYTIEAGLGDNPLPMSAFDGIYESNVGILTRTAVFET